MKRMLYIILSAFLVVSCSTSKVSLVRMTTTEGVIDLKLYEETEAHKKNFVKLVKEHKYDSLLFHRVIKDFMIQGGDPDSKKASRGKLLGEGDLGYKVPAEFMPELYFHKRGALAAARESDDVNPEKASTASQFYIVWGTVFSKEHLKRLQEHYAKKRGKDIVFTPQQVQAYTTIGGTPHLDGEYTVFGEVVNGLDVVKKIQDKRCDKNDRPLENVRILKVELLK
ncbi:MAG: peptidylprolyl isomerase [Bacteroidaceae bacterium]|nr:peptidylprolyl isomerase [Bacteroidaceae bacterium]